MSPTIVVEGLSLASRTGSVFSDVSFRVEPGALSVVVGPSGSGRSALLLAVGGRMKGVTGTVRLGDRPGRSRPADLRRSTSLARLATLVGPEDKLTVAESVTERALVDGVQPAVARRAVAAAEQALAVSWAPRRLVEELGAYEQALLCVALAVVRPTDLVLFDDADRGLDVEDQVRLFAALQRLCATGPAVLAATTEVAAVPAGVALMHLRPQGAARPAAAAPAVSPTPTPPAGRRAATEPVPASRPDHEKTS